MLFNKILTLFVLLICTTPTLASLILPIVDIYDGDTIKTQITLPPPLDEVSIRVLHLDTPERPARSYYVTGKLGKASCVKEAELGLKARRVVMDIAHGSDIMTVTNFDYGKFAGRIVGDVSINGKDIATELIRRQLGVVYDGKKKTKDWCD